MEKDISLDDLIKQDKSKVKPKTKPIAKNQTKGKAFAQPRNLGGRANDNQGGNGKFGRGKQNNINVNPNQNNPRRLKGAKLSNKLQPKHFIAQNNQNNQKNGNQKNEPRQAPPAPQKQTAPPQEKGKTLRVLGLQADVTNEELYKLFSSEGALEKCFIEQDNFGRKLPSAIVKYYDGEKAKSAKVNFHKYKLNGSILQLELLGKQ